ncbi:MAG: hypothetical protein PHT13_00295 [Methanosarcina sp.]|jgi:hypothetical protein|nr:hypothetical protein [Methanosarcina sp.]
MTRKIYFDMDGVLVNFMKFANTHFPDLMREQTNDIVFWNTIDDRCGTDFWPNLEPIPHGVRLLREAQELFDGDISLLTAIPKYDGDNVAVKEDARKGKIQWVANHLGDVPFLMTRRREKIDYCTDSDSILIDDFAKTVNEWNEHGGHAILFRVQEPENFEESKMLLVGVYFKICGLPEMGPVVKRFNPDYWTFECIEGEWYVILKPTEFSCEILEHSFANFKQLEEKVQARIPGFKVIGTEFITDLPVLDLKEIVCR